ncbi:glycerol-3-phosphate dehydrogenase [Bradyrhizobium erythrophlei]|jgi:glycerol-3-phosphate dehydrogenase|uniref:Glycerol-3-phosphate dehydrogenase n=1 Tax=Bradyrhizobium erythrophlei TaxID=1437360 RepID=A0A1M7TGI7_9BRAD|nr:glycerol-3-phosphate dehydrogenase [Bradyrhizobium erythrophlei]SHN69825.1 glycerol-3-phosphate dehydrogenase [Bradyrhizobium erythrophlei]
MADYDLAIIGGGLNGVSVARDAAGRGLRVILIEQGDLGGAASCASGRLIQGDLAVLERRAFRRTREALAEREAWMRIAPHLVRPAHFVIPAHSDERPPWLLQLGLFVYDRLAPRDSLPRSAAIDITHHPIGDALQRPFGTAFGYSDCLADDSRLVIASAVDAAERGAVIRTGARCVRADRSDIWRLVVIDRGHRQVITTRALVNAAGAWTATVAETVLRVPPPRASAVKLGQIIVRRLFETDNVYVLQNSDRRLVFASPYQRDFTMIGTVARSFVGDPAAVAISAHEVTYLCDAANRYFREHIDPSDVIRSVAGVNLVTGRPGKRFAREGTVTFDARRRRAPLLTIFGGDVTTARLRAERAVSRLLPFYPMSKPWSAQAVLPGGDFPRHGFETEVENARERWKFLTADQALRLVAAYGSRLGEMLGEARQKADLGESFGPELTEAEVRYLMTREWARFPDDILWRRSKLGLTMEQADRERLATFMATA